MICILNWLQFIEEKALCLKFSCNFMSLMLLDLDKNFSSFIPPVAISDLCFKLVWWFYNLLKRRLFA